MLSACEQRSVKAERQIHSIKKARFMAKHVGEEFDGVVSSVTRFGLFVQLRQFDVDGLIRVEELGGDRFEFDEEKLRLVGKKSGMAYEIGEPMRIQVAKADIELGQIDFVMPEDARNAAAKSQASVSKRVFPSSGRKQAPKDNSRSVRKSRVSQPRRSR
jgi:ribonuclease R